MRKTVPFIYLNQKSDIKNKVALFLIFLLFSLSCAQSQPLKIFKLDQSYEMIMRDGKNSITTLLNVFKYSKSIGYKTILFAKGITESKKYTETQKENSTVLIAFAGSYETLKYANSQINYLTSSVNAINNTKQAQANAEKSVSVNENENKHYVKIILLVLIMGTCILMFFFVTRVHWLKKNNNNKYAEIIHEFTSKEKDNSASQKSDEEISSTKSSNITDETARQLIVKLKKFESTSKYLKKDISLT